MPKYSTTPVAQSVPFNNSGLPWTETNLQAALASVRNQLINIPTSTATTLNGTLNLISASTTVQAITGTQTGYSVVLPDATTLFSGATFSIFNRSTQAVLVKTYDGTILITLNAGDMVEVRLRVNSPAAGDWMALPNSSLAAGVNAFNVVASSLFSTSSTTDTPLNGLTVTPPSGTYAVWFSSDVTIGANNKVAQCVIFKDGLEVADTRRNQQGVGSNFKTNLQSLGIISVNGSQALDVRVNISSGTLDILGRSFLVIRLGA